jgi:hypothetical protein
MAINARDRDLKIPDRLACIVAEMTSGVLDAHPESVDHDLANEVYEFIRERLDREYE